MNKKIRILENLNSIKSTLRDTADPSIIKALDDAIKEITLLEQDVLTKKKYNHRVLIILGKVLDKLPSLMALIKTFYE